MQATEWPHGVLDAGFTTEQENGLQSWRAVPWLQGRRTFDKALAALPITQHDRIWQLYLVRARGSWGSAAPAAPGGA